MFSKITTKKLFRNVLLMAAVCFAIGAVYRLAQPGITYVATPIEAGQSYRAYEAEALEAVREIDGAVYSTMYSIDLSYPLRREETYVLIPYLRQDVGAVPTAGSASWSYEVGVLALRWRSERQIPMKEIIFQDAALSITADSNTALQLDGPHFHRDIWGTFAVSKENHTASRFIECSAVTKESAKEQNAVRVCVVQWEGTCGVSRFPGPVLAAQFQVASEADYINNVVSR